MKARVGVIGTGWWSTRAHLPALAANPDAQLVAVADPDTERRSVAAERFGVPRSFADYRSMLDQIPLDAVVIAIPHAFHYEAALDALKHGLHVLVEKPMVLDPAHGRHLLEEAAASRRELIVGYPFHFNPQSLIAREWIEQERLGDLVLIQSFYATMDWPLFRGRIDDYAGGREYRIHAPGEQTYSNQAIAGGGQGQTVVTHSAALLFFLTGLTCREVFAYMNALDSAVDVVDALAIRFNDRCIGLLGSTGTSVPTQSQVLEYWIYGTDGHLLFRPEDGTLALREGNGSVTQAPVPPSDLRYPERAPADNLVDVTLGRAGNGSPGEIGLRTVELLSAAYRSAAEGRPIELGSG